MAQNEKKNEHSLMYRPRAYAYKNNNSSIIVNSTNSSSSSGSVSIKLKLNQQLLLVSPAIRCWILITAKNIKQHTYALTHTNTYIDENSIFFCWPQLQVAFQSISIQHACIEPLYVYGDNVCNLYMFSNYMMMKSLNSPECYCTHCVPSS